MKIITYLGFTLMSILVQFSVMEYIQERLNDEEKPMILNFTSPRRQFPDLLQEYASKPHALYYRTSITPMNRLLVFKNMSTTKIYSKNSLSESLLVTTTDTASTTLEELYEESSITDLNTTTESFYTSTESDNVTEFILFEKKNKTKDQTDVPKTKFYNNECDCNFLFKVCDINCCCDSDCSDAEFKLFTDCIKADLPVKQKNVCYPEFNARGYKSNHINNFLCIVKTNLPEKRNINIKYDPMYVSRAKEITIKWRNTEIPILKEEFTKKQYVYGDPIWLLKNGSIHFLDVSSPVINNYCTGKKQVQFLKEDKIKCSIKLTHLEMIQTMKTVDESSIISVIDRTMNATVLDCSTLHCTNWSVIVCDSGPCTTYNKSLHEPFCTDSKCTYIAVKMDYIFYYHDMKIVNASVILYTQNVSLILPFMTQEINVNFILANTSINQALRFSGAPGYVHGLPVIASFVESNHSDIFFNNKSMKKYLTMPTNENGKCVWSTPENTLRFGFNKRIKCRFSLERNILAYNGTYACKTINNKILEYIGLNQSIFISPRGNPHGQKDEDWIRQRFENFEKEITDGEFLNGKSSISCSNVLTTILIVFTYADKSTIDSKTVNQILTASTEFTARNVTIYEEDFTTVLTIDTTFVDVTRPPVYEFAASPDLNIHLPRDFFFPFPNNGFVIKCNLVYLFCLCGAALVKIK